MQCFQNSQHIPLIFQRLKKIQVAPGYLKYELLSWLFTWEKLGITKEAYRPRLDMFHIQGKILTAQHGMRDYPGQVYCTLSGRWCIIFHHRQYDNQYSKYKPQTFPQVISDEL